MKLVLSIYLLYFFIPGFAQVITHKDLSTQFAFKTKIKRLTNNGAFNTCVVTVYIYDKMKDSLIQTIQFT
jgi:hypothetical protein